MDNVELVPIRERNPKVSRNLAAAIEKAMAVHPEDRFQSAEEFKQALLNSKSNSNPPEGEIVVTPPPQSRESGENRKLADELPNEPGKPPIPPSTIHPHREGSHHRLVDFHILFPFDHRSGPFIHPRLLVADHKCNLWRPAFVYAQFFAYFKPWHTFCSDY